MKIVAKTLSLALGVLFLAGCASTCKKCETPAAQAAPVAAVQPAQVVAAPVQAAPVQQAAETESIPAAVRK